MCLFYELEQIKKVKLYERESKRVIINACYSDKLNQKAFM